MSEPQPEPAPAPVTPARRSIIGPLLLIGGLATLIAFVFGAIQHPPRGANTAVMIGFLAGAGFVQTAIVGLGAFFLFNSMTKRAGVGLLLYFWVVLVWTAGAVLIAIPMSQAAPPAASSAEAP